MGRRRLLGTAHGPDRCYAQQAHSEPRPTAALAASRSPRAHPVALALLAHADALGEAGRGTGNCGGAGGVRRRAGTRWQRTATAGPTPPPLRVSNLSAQLTNPGGHPGHAVAGCIGAALGRAGGGALRGRKRGVGPAVHLAAALPDLLARGERMAGCEAISGRPSRCRAASSCFAGAAAAGEPPSLERCGCCTWPMIALSASLKPSS